MVIRILEQWEKHCDTSVRELDFVPVGEEWPSMYYHPKLQLMLVIYVDDLKLAGPAENLKKGWEMLRTKLRIEPETDLGLYLGCILSKDEAQMYVRGVRISSIPMLQYLTALDRQMKVPQLTVRLHVGLWRLMLQVF